MKTTNSLTSDSKTLITLIKISTNENVEGN
jgi:hypothetical protein